MKWWSDREREPDCRFHRRFTGTAFIEPSISRMKVVLYKKTVIGASLIYAYFSDLGYFTS
jgi:hypothetical protein